MALPIWTSSASTDWAVAGNWSTAAVPVSTDSVFLQNNAVAIASSLNQSAVTLAKLVHSMSYTGLVAASATYLQIAASLVTLGAGFPVGTLNTGSRRFNLNLGSTASVVTLLNSASSATDAGVSPVRLLGTSITLNAFGGVLGVAEALGETATLTALTMNRGSSGGSPTIKLGTGVTLTLLYQYAGTLTNASAQTVPAATIGGGTYLFNGTGTHTALTVNKTAKASLNAACTVTALTLRGTLDLSQGSGAVTFTNSTFYAGFKLLDPGKRAVFTNPFWLPDGALSDGSFNLGPNRTYTVT